MIIFLSAIIVMFMFAAAMASPSEGFPLSTGSIIATPEPVTTLVLALGLVPLLLRRGGKQGL